MELSDGESARQENARPERLHQQLSDQEIAALLTVESGDKAGPPPGQGFPLEEHFSRFFAESGLNRAHPVDIAVRGGLAADRLAWVFVSGYQAAVRWVFPELPQNGWVAFAASENAAVGPGVQLSVARSAEDGRPRGIVNGHKSWVAQSRSLSAMAVTARFAEASYCVLLPVVRDASTNEQPELEPGVQLTHREAPGFLADMSQGYAQFANVEVRQFTADERTRRFVRLEPVFVMLAAVSFLAGCYRRDPMPSKASAIADLVDIALALVDVLPERIHEGLLEIDSLKTSPQPESRIDPATVPDVLQLAHIDALWGDAVAVARENLHLESVPGWSTDRRLLRLYSAGLQKRAAKHS